MYQALVDEDGSAGLAALLTSGNAKHQTCQTECGQDQQYRIGNFIRAGQSLSSIQALTAL